MEREPPIDGLVDRSTQCECVSGKGAIDVDQALPGVEEVGGMVIRSTRMRETLRMIQRLGPYKASVLIEGESGTGKELVARALHTSGPFPAGPFVTFNCSNLVESLAETQLFGHVRGAFTDARESSLGYFRSANSGTLFLDEIGELPLRLQPKLLRVVETHEVQPVGSAKSYRVDIRLIAATNRDLRTMVKAGEFRDDLYYRISATPIIVPPLRDRREAIEALAVHFIKYYNVLFSKHIRYLSCGSLGVLQGYRWPGNVRELSHAIQSAVMLADSELLCVHNLPAHLLPRESVDKDVVPNRTISSGSSVPVPPITAVSLEDVVSEASKKALIHALRETGDNCSRAAELLGVSRYTVYRMMTRYGLASGREKTNPKLYALFEKNPEMAVGKGKHHPGAGLL